MQRYRIEVKEISENVLDVDEWKKVRDLAEGEDKPEYAYVTTRKLVKNERPVLIYELDTIDIGGLTKFLNRKTTTPTTE